MNDNDPIIQEMNWDFLELMTEEQKLGLILYLIGQGGVQIETAFVNSDEGDVLTHELLQISCGDYSVYSHPEPLTHPLRPATGAELNKTVN